MNCKIYLKIGELPSKTKYNKLSIVKKYCEGKMKKKSSILNWTVVKRNWNLI